MQTNQKHSQSILARHPIAFILGTIVFLISVSSGGVWAYWTSNASATGSLSTNTASVTQANFSTLGAAYRPDRLSSTGSFSVTNNGQIAGTGAVDVTTANPLASKLNVWIWVVPGTTSCTDATAVPSSNVISATWATVPRLSPTLSPSQSIVYCVRTVAPDWKTLTTPSGSQAAQLTLNVSLDAAGWVATTSQSQQTQSTGGMFPLTTGFFDASLSRWFKIVSKANTSVCLDVEGSGAAGTKALSWTCNTGSNQRWEFVPVSGTNQDLVTLRPRHAGETRLTYDPTGKQLLANASAALSQQWYVQQLAGGTQPTMQLVNASNGKCLGLRNTSSGSDMPTVNCDDPGAQLVLQREPLTYSSTSTTQRFTFGGATVSTASTLQKRMSNGTWAVVSTTAAGASYVEFTYTISNTSLANYIESGTTEYRIMDANNQLLWNGITLNRSSSTGVITPSGGFN